ncbi:MAG: hypothetical protein M1834_000218 [Cirrosporium novae-zelandiae]|nr:MAG: hypothetical protein M1834_000218 [Cirrosporium novae-zelandiae]
MSSRMSSEDVQQDTQSKVPPRTFPTDDQLSLETTPQSLSQALYARRAEYLVQKQIRIRIGSWNVGSLPGTEDELAKWFVQGGGIVEGLAGIALEDDKIKEVQKDSPESIYVPPVSLPKDEEVGLYVLGLQEVVDVTSMQEALRVSPASGISDKWKEAAESAMPPGYQLVAEQQLVGLLILIYASPSIAPTVSSVSTTSVGTGFLGYLGNKGAVLTRLVLGETTRLVFVNCHLTAGAQNADMERRNWDISQTISRARFQPIKDESGAHEGFGENLGDEDFAFLFGDLNYRVDTLPGDDVRRLLSLHTRNEYNILRLSEQNSEDAVSKRPSSEVSRDEKTSPSPSEDSSGVGNRLSTTTESSRTAYTADLEVLAPESDPASLQTTITSLLPHDQLHKQMHRRKALHDGWREGKIDFLPTYKYDVGTISMFDSSEKRRCPSWCDRILFRTRRDKLDYEQKIKEEEENRKNDEEMKAQGLEETAFDDNILFEYDPETDGTNKDDDYNEDEDAESDWEPAVTRESADDKIKLEYYTSHQKVLSSDHKPLSAAFLLNYDAVDPEKKAKIHQEVARDLDRAENEGRPVITIVIDPNTAESGGGEAQESEVFEGVDLGIVSYLFTKTRSMTIANTGSVRACFGFIDRPVPAGERGGVSPSWLSINFDRSSDNDNLNTGALREYTMEPGDTVNVELCATIEDIEMVRGLNEGKLKIEDVLVLRVQNGRDHFVPIRGRWLPTSFGQSLDSLLRLPEGGVRQAHQKSPNKDPGPKNSAPRELFRLTEAIEELTERAVAEWEMTHENIKPPWVEHTGWPFEPASWILANPSERAHLTQIVRDALDEGKPFNQAFPSETSSLYRVEVLAETLVLFIQSLQDGVITEVIWEELEKGVQAREKGKRPLNVEEEQEWILDVLSKYPARSVSFTFLTFMLTRVANEVAPLHPIPTMSPRNPTTMSKTGKANTLSQDPARARRQLVENSFASIFSSIVIRAPLAPREKEKRASEQRRKEVLEVFLTAKWGTN